MIAAATIVPTLRLVRDVETLDPPIGDLESLRSQVVELQSEVDGLRRRSDQLNFHLSRIDAELKLAARLQQDFLPKKLPQIGNVHFEALFRPAGHVSGDFYDVIRLDETHVGFYIADAVGHGVPAALLTMFIKHSLATKQIGVGGYRLLSAVETMARLNQSLLDQSLSAATFATAIYGVVDTTTGMVDVARAGHPYPMILRADRSVETPACEGGLLGVFPGETYTPATIQLSPGDRLILTTDGVEVLFPGEADAAQRRWGSELSTRLNLPSDELLNSVADLIDQDGCSPLRDDVTMLVIDVR